MDAHNGAVAPVSSELRRASFHEAALAPNAVESANSTEKLGHPNPPARKQEMEGQNYGSKSLFAGKEQVGSTRMSSIVEESYGSSRFLPEEEGVSAQNSGLAGESYESKRFLLSCSVASGRAKKKRRSRASSKAPIKVFSTDTTNFMAMVHKLTGIPSNASPFHSMPLPWTPKMLPFNQGLPTLDTSTLLLPTFSGDRVLNSISYPSMQSLASQQQLNPVCADMKATSQAGQLAANLDCTSSSYVDLMRSMCSSVNSSSLPRLWEAAYASERNAAHQPQHNSFTEVEGITRQEPSHQDATVEPNLPTSNTFSRIEMLLAGSGKLASSSTSMLTSCMAKEELL